MCCWRSCSPDSISMSSLRSHRKVELRGPPPAHLTIRNETRRIQKPAREPIIVYMVSPKIIHAEASEFMALVQRLTGRPASRPRGESSAAHHQSSPGSRKFPVRVKARVPTHDPSLQSPIAPNPMHDSSPPSPFGIGARKEGFLASQSLPLRGDYSGQPPGLPSSYVLGSPNYQGIISQAGDPEHHWYQGVGELFFRG